MTKFLSIMPVLRVTNLRRSIEWYTQVLHFSAREPSQGDGDFQNCFLSAGETDLLLSTGEHLGGAPSFTGTLYFAVNGVDELWSRVAGRPEVVWELGEQEYGTREFGIRDPDGYLLAFAETTEP